jgi:preprotein translocase subunit SecE
VAEKVEKEKKPNVIQKYYRETSGELRKVTWPTRQEALRLTMIVIIVMFGMAVILGLLDTLFARIVTAIIA